MTTTTLILPDDAGVPEGARQLGVRNAPSLRLSIGFRNPQRSMAPDKLDHFRAKEGPNGEYRAAAAKFHSPPTEDGGGGYGATPRAIDIRLPQRLEDAMRIEYLAFKGNREDPAGGVMVARGHTNFAPLGYCGGPDILTVWDEDGTVRQVETRGVDAITKQPLDQEAASLGLMLCTTFCVGLPKILGYGSHAEITSKSLRSTDQIWHKLRDWYAAFPNGTISFAMRPLLVVKPAYARPVIKKDGKMFRARVLIYVLDVVQPESEDEMIRRLETYRGAVAPSGLDQRPVAELEAGALAPSAGPAPVEQIRDAVEEITDAEIITENSEPSPPAGSEQPIDAAAGSAAAPDATTPVAGGVDPTDTEPVGVERDEIPRLASGDSSQQATAVATPSAAAPGDLGAEPVLVEEEPAPAPAGPTPDDLQAAEAAARVKPPFGSYQNRTLGWILGNPNGRAYLEYAIKMSVSGGFQKQDAKFERHLWAFVKVHVPELYEANKEAAK